MKSTIHEWTFDEPYQCTSGIWVCNAHRPSPLIGSSFASGVMAEGSTAQTARDAAIFAAGQLTGKWDHIAWETARAVMGVSR